MLKRFLLFVLVEEALMLGFLIWSYYNSATVMGSDACCVVMGTFGSAMAVSDLAAFLLGRNRPWGTLGLSRRLGRVGASFLASLLAFIVAFACIGLVMPVNSAVSAKLSLLAALGAGSWALVGVELSRGDPERTSQSHPVRSERAHGGSAKGNSLNASAVSGLRLSDGKPNRLEDLRRLIPTLCQGEDGFRTAEAIRSLRAVGEDLVRVGGPELIEFVRLVDSLFADVLVRDIGLRAAEWEERSADTAWLLDAAEGILESTLASAKTNPLSLSSDGLERIADASLLQRIQTYRCLNVAVSGDAESFYPRLAQVLEIVESNVGLILEQDDPHGLAMLESSVRWGGYSPYARCWTAPLSLVAHAAREAGLFRSAVIGVYGRYVCFLKRLARETSALGGLLMDAQLTLSFLQGEETRAKHPDLPARL